MTQAFDLSQAESYCLINVISTPLHPMHFFYPSLFLQHHSKVAHKISLSNWGLECSAGYLKLCGSFLLGSCLRKWSGFTER